MKRNQSRLGSRIIALSTLIVILALMIAACSPAAKEEDKFTIGYSASTLTGEFNKRVSQELQAECDKRGIELITLSAEGDVNAQTQQIENFITMGVDAMIIFPVDPAVMGAPMKQAREAGIFVVDADQLAEKGSFDVGLSVDMAQLGVTTVKLASDWVDKTFPNAEPGSVKVAVFGVWLTEQFAKRGDVMMDMASYNDKVTVVAKYEMGLDYATTLPQYVGVLLQEHPDISVILSFTDTFALIIDELLLQEPGLDLSKIGQFTVDWSQGGLEAIQKSANNESTIRGTAATNIQIAQELVDGALGKLEVNEDGIYYGRIDPISADNVNEFIELTKQE